MSQQKTQGDSDKVKKPLIGYMIFEAWTDDDDGNVDPTEDWDGVITGPHDPTGANRAWEKPIKMIEYSAFEKAQAESVRHFASALKKLLKPEEVEYFDKVISRALFEQRIFL